MGPNLTLFETRVGRRIIGLFMAGALVPVLVMAWIARDHVGAQLERQAEERTAASAKSVGMDVGHRLVATRDLLIDQAARLEVAGETRATEGLRPPPGVTTLRLDSAEALPSDARTRLESRRAILVMGPTGATTRIGVPVRGGAQVLWATLEPSYLWGIIDGAPPLGRGQSLCVFGPGRAVPICTAESAGEIRTALRTASEGSFQVGDREIGAAWALFLGFEFGAPSWTIVVSEDAATVAAPLVSFNRAFLTVIGLTVFVVLGLSAWMIRRAMVPLRELKSATEQIAARNLDHRVALSHGGRDEFHELADSFNGMAEEIAGHLEALVAIHTFDRAILSSLERTSVVRALVSRGEEILPGASVALILSERGHRVERWYRHRPDGAPGSDIVMPPRLLVELRRRPEGWSASPVELDDLERLLGLEARAIAAAEVLPITFGDGPGGVLVVGTVGEDDVDQPTLSALRHLVDQATVALQNVRLVEELGALHRGALEALANAIDAKSPWTAGHSQRVTRLAVRLGERIRLPQVELERLYRGGLLHDVGKIGIAQAILDKTGQLEPAERVAIESHPVIGANIVSPITAFEDVIGIVRHHHERWDGAGYPDRLEGRAIPRLARVLALADVYDALTSPRPYRDPMPHDAAMAIIREGLGTAFDPEIGAVFVEMMARVADRPLPAAVMGTPILEEVT